MSCKIGVSTMLLPQKELAEAVDELFEASHRLITHYELLCDGPKNHPELLTAEHLRQLRQMASEKGLTFSVHAPCYDVNPASHNRGARCEAVRQYKECVGLAERLGIGELVVHAGQRSSGLESGEETAAYSVESLAECMEFAEIRGIRLLVENTGVGYGQFLGTPTEFLSIIKAVAAYGDARALLDTGHAAVMGWDLRESATVLGDALGQIHCHDNGGKADEHLPLGYGVLDLPGFIENITSRRWSGILVLEIYDSDPMGGLAASIRHLETMGVRI